MLKVMFHEDHIRGLNLSEELEPQTHQQCVDDTMLMGPYTIQEARGINKGLYTFLETNGLEINREKSQVYFFNTLKITQRNILKIPEFSEGVLPSKYMGAPLAESTIKQIY